VQVLHIGIVDFRQAAEARSLEIFRRPNPLAVIGEPGRRVAVRSSGADRRCLRDTRIILLFVAFAARDEQ